MPAPILVLASTRAEIGPFGRMAGADAFSGKPVPISRGKIGRIPVLLALSGVGKANAAFSAGHLLAQGKYRAVVNLGCAGAFPGSRLSIGDVVLASREVLADEGVLVRGGFLDLEQLSLASPGPGGANSNSIPIRLPCRLSRRTLNELSEKLGFPVRAGTLCTVSTASGTSRRAAEISAHWNPLAESMEGAAFALAA